MRLRYILPAIEIAASVAFVFIPLYRYLPLNRAKGLDGKEIHWGDGPPLPRFLGINPVTFAKGINLPTMPVVLLVLSAKWDYSHDGHDYFHDPVWQGVGFAIPGIVVWYFAGRFCEELITWRRTKLRPRIFILDFTFCLVASGVATMTAIVGLQYAGFPGRLWLALCSIFWIVIGYSGITMWLFQLIQNKLRKFHASC